MCCVWNLGTDQVTKHCLVQDVKTGKFLRPFISSNGNWVIFPTVAPNEDESVSFQTQEADSVYSCLKEPAKLKLTVTVWTTPSTDCPAALTGQSVVGWTENSEITCIELSPDGKGVSD